MSKELAVTIGTTSYQLRRNAGLSIEQVAEAIELSPMAYARIERGRLLPSAATVVALCKLFRVHVDVLLGPNETQA